VELIRRELREDVWGYPTPKACKKYIKIIINTTNIYPIISANVSKIAYSILN
jgi:hypothetical protein